METMQSKVKYLLSLDAVRDRAKIVGEAAKQGKLTHFDVHEDKLDEVAEFVAGLIKVLSLFTLDTNVHLTSPSETLAPQTSTPSLPMADGSILIQEMSHVFPHLLTSGNPTLGVNPMIWKSRGD